MDANIAHNVLSWLLGTACGWIVNQLIMWHKLREQKARADKAVAELEEYRLEIKRNRDERAFEETLPLRIADVQIAFQQLRRSSPEQPNCATLSRLAQLVPMDASILRKVLEVMKDKNMVKIVPSAFTPEEVDISLTASKTPDFL